MTDDPSNPYLPPPPTVPPPGSAAPAAPASWGAPAPAWVPPALARDAHGVAVLRMAREHRTRLLIVGPVVLVVASVLAYGRYGVVGGAWFVGIVALVLVVSAVIAWQARTTLTPTTLVRSTFGGPGRTIQLADVGEVILFPRLQFGAAQAPPLLVVRDRAGRRLTAMASPQWAPTDLLALAYALSPHPAVYPTAIKPIDVERQHPGSMRFHEKHPWWFAWAIVGGVVVGVTVFVLVATIAF